MNISLITELITSQFPVWKNLPIQPVEPCGWDNHTYRLGNELLVRLPSGATYAPQVEKENLWLPRLAPVLPLKIPCPVAVGKPNRNYPWNWSIYKWLEGTTASTKTISHIDDFAVALAHFLRTLQKMDTTGGPFPGPDNFHRGGALSHYDKEMRQALTRMKNQIDSDQALKIWEKGLHSHWLKPPVWVHGDISPNNLLVNNGQLCAVIDFGLLAVGDPACDLMIAWTFFEGKSRDIFRSTMALDPETWERARAWTLWKASVIVSGLSSATHSESIVAPKTLERVLEDQ